jgi:hypothetical protein
MPIVHAVIECLFSTVDETRWLQENRQRVKNPLGGSSTAHGLYVTSAVAVPRRIQLQ